MGQYHKIVNIDKREYLHPHHFGDGLKLMEFGMSGDGGTMTGLAILLGIANKGGARGGGDFHCDDPLVGSWGGDRIAIVGDYAEDEDWNLELPASIVYTLCASPEEIEQSAAHWDTIGDEYAQRAALIRTMQPYTDMSAHVVRLLSAAGERPERDAHPAFG